MVTSTFATTSAIENTIENAFNDEDGTEITSMKNGKKLSAENYSDSQVHSLECVIDEGKWAKADLTDQKENQPAMPEDEKKSNFKIAPAAEKNTAIATTERDPASNSELAAQERADLGLLEERIRSGISQFYFVGLALKDIRDRKLYRIAFKSFQTYCKERWDMSRRTAYQQINAAMVIENVRHGAQNLTVMPANERQARSLTQLQPEQQLQAWKKVLEQAGQGPVTSQLVQKVVEQFLPRKQANRSLKYKKLTDFLADLKLNETEADLAEEMLLCGYARLSKEALSINEGNPAALEKLNKVRVALGDLIIIFSGRSGFHAPGRRSGASNLRQKIAPVSSSVGKRNNIARPLSPFAAVAIPVQ